MKHGFNKPAAVVNRDVVIGETITVAELANKMAVKGVEVIKVMMKMGTMATISQVIDQETAQLVAEEDGSQGGAAPRERAGRAARYCPIVTRPRSCRVRRS